MKVKLKSLGLILLALVVIGSCIKAFCYVWPAINLEDISTNGVRIDSLFNYTTFMNVFYFTLVCIGLFGFSYLYYYKRNPKPYYTHGNKKKQLFTTTVIGIAIFLSIDLTITVFSNQDLINVFWNYPNEDEEEVIKVEVLAQQWAWNFRYAGADGKFNTVDDIVTVNDLRIPKGKKIVFNLTSKDVIHSFYVPNVKIKVDTIPGRITRIWWDANKAGIYDIACAEMCGTHHYLMKAKLTVYEYEDWLKWKNEAQNIAVATNDPDNLDLYWGWRWDLRK